MITERDLRRAQAEARLAAVSVVTALAAGGRPEECTPAVGNELALMIVFDLIEHSRQARVPVADTVAAWRRRWLKPGYPGGNPPARPSGQT